MAEEKAKKAKIGIGLVTYNRLDYYRTARASIKEHLGFVDHVVAYHDGPRPKYYPTGVVARQTNLIYGTVNLGVAHAKNNVMRRLLDLGCDYLFIMEDDMEILDKKAVIGYLAAHKMVGVPHLNFHGHGDNLRMLPKTAEGPLLYWPNAVGAWSFYTAEILRKVGLMDENFINAYEHVEHTWRIYKGYINYGFYPDVVGSEEWIRAQPGALVNSSIRDPDDKWQIRIKKGLDYWRSIDADCPAIEPNWAAYTNKKFDV